MPGAVVVVGHEGQIVYRRAFGYRQIKPREIPMTIDTVFDLASLTKPIATATSIMKLIEKKQLDISAPVSRYLPEFGRNGKQSITVQQLLTHTGGLIPDNALSDYANGKAQAMENIFSHLQKETFRRFLRQATTVDEVVELIQEADSQYLPS